MEEVNTAHKEKFGIYPMYIGINWRLDQLTQIDRVYESIDTNTPYNEYNLLSKEEQKAFDSGDLMF